MRFRRSEDRSVLSRRASGPDVVLPLGGQPADVRFAGPDDGRPLLVVVHGGFWRPAFDRAHLRPLTEALAAAGWASVAPEYRRVPGRPDLAVADVHEAVGAVGAVPEFAGRRLVLVGHSAGGHLVLHGSATSEAPVDVLALAPVADLRLAQQLRLDGDAVTAFLGVDADARPDLDPARLPTPAGRVSLLHGTGDDIVPVTVSESYLRQHPAAELTRVDGGHFALIDPRSTAWPALLGVLDGLR